MEKPIVADIKAKINKIKVFILITVRVLIHFLGLLDLKKLYKEFF